MVGELGLDIAGGVLLWRLVLSPAARRCRAASPLPVWDVRPLDFGLWLWGAFMAWFGVGVLAFNLLGKAGVVGEECIVGAGAAAQLAMLGVCLGFRARATGGQGYAPVIRRRLALRDGAVTLVMAIPVVFVVALGWRGLMHAAGLPDERQELVDFFSTADSPVLLLVLVGLAVVVAPVTEELVFRGGLFHFARGRLPRWAALLLPACIFAALHHNLAGFAPLAALGVIFSLAYERTGNLAVPMVAHALFNLHTVALILLGVDK